MNSTALQSQLFQPFQLKGLSLPNRIVMAPMTRSKSPEGVPGDDVAAYYRRRVEGGVGLIITEGTFVDDKNCGLHWYPKVPHVYGEEALRGWGKVVEQVHQAGGLIFPQLWHLGMAANNGVNPTAEQGIGPSGLGADGTIIGEPMSLKRIEEAQAAFVRSAISAKQLGFDGIELHGAHGYFIDQFFWADTNKRTDKYGGVTCGERARFAAELICQLRRELGPDYPICLRLSQWKPGAFEFKNAKNPQELENWLAPLIEAGVDLFHCSTRRFWQPEFEGSNLNLAGWVKKLSGLPTITVGSVSLNEDFIKTFREDQEDDKVTFHDLEERLERHEFDLVAVGRALISNPDWANLVKENRVSQLKAYRREDLAKLY